MSKVFVLNGWAASEEAWSLCRFRRERVFSYVEQLDGEPEKVIAAEDDVVLVGWSMGGSSAMRLALRWPEKIRGLVLVAATPRMMEDKPAGWRGMSERRLAALKKGLLMTGGGGFFGPPAGLPNPYIVDDEANLDRGLGYLVATDLRSSLLECEALRTKGERVRLFQSEHDGIVRPENATFLEEVFRGAKLRMIPGVEHALPIFIPEMIDSAVEEVSV
ncbi:MAG: alpha/beta fold hydrolase [Kiritimatiellae bacterium]|nr:alpha/beta fold hydrolase [Kiritimatiellia bacterium]